MSKGLWIPLEILNERGLTPMERLVLAEVVYLHGARGCHAGNAHFAELFGIGKSRVSQIVSGLVGKGYVECSLRRKGKRVVGRTIIPLGNLKGVLRNPNEPLEKCATTPLGKRKDRKQDRIQREIQGVTCGEGSARGFEAFWEAYPRKENKRAAQRAWERLSPSQRLQDDIMAAIEKQKQLESWQKENGKYIPHASTWLKNTRWEDEVAADPNGVEQLETHDATEEEADALMQEVEV
jgi:hypothetical protein